MAGTTLSEAIDQYMAHRVSNQMSTNTLRTNRGSLSLFLATVGNVQMRHLNSQHGSLFRSFLTGKGYQANTVNSHIDSVRGFIAWAHERRYLPPGNNPLAGIRRATPLPKQRQRIAKADFPRLLDCAHSTTTDPVTGERVEVGNPHDRIIVAIGLSLFLRQSEIMSLKVGDLDLDAEELHVVMHKTSASDTMVVQYELGNELRRFLSWYANDVKDAYGPLQPSWYLVPRRVPPMLTGRKGERGGVQVPRAGGNCIPTRPVGAPHRSVQRALTRFGLPTHDENGKSLMEGVHTLRRSGARVLYDDLCDKGHDRAMTTVQAMLHHSTASMTEKYLGMNVNVKQRNDLMRGRKMWTPDASASANVIPLHPVAETN